MLDIIKKIVDSSPKTAEKKIEGTDTNLDDQKRADLLDSFRKLIGLENDVKNNKNGIEGKDDSTTEKGMEKSLDRKQKKVYKRLQTFEKIMPIAKKYVSITDGTVPIETVIWLIPGIWDMSIWVVNASVMGYFWTKLSMGLGYQFKNLAMQTVDTGVWSIPVVGDVIDAFFKSNRRMYRNFLKAYDRLIKKAEGMKLPWDIVSKARSKREEVNLKKLSITKRMAGKKAVTDLFGKVA